MFIWLHYIATRSNLQLIQKYICSKRIAQQCVSGIPGVWIRFKGNTQNIVVCRKCTEQLILTSHK
jgi:ribosomal protein L40E